MVSDFLGRLMLPHKRYVISKNLSTSTTGTGSVPTILFTLSVSLNPLPVTRQTRVASGSISPRFAAPSTPAKATAPAGSQKIPSSRASIDCTA